MPFLRRIGIQSGLLILKRRAVLPCLIGLLTIVAMSVANAQTAPKETEDVVVTGALARTNQVVYIDPARGFPMSVSLQALNQLMMRFPMRTIREVEGAGLNPFHFPTSSPVRSTVAVH